MQVTLDAKTNLTFLSLLHITISQLAEMIVYSHMTCQINISVMPKAHTKCNLQINSCGVSPQMGNIINSNAVLYETCLER